jgi:hypothetical protein
MQKIECAQTALRVIDLFKQETVENPYGHNQVDFEKSKMLSIWHSIINDTYDLPSEHAAQQARYAQKRIEKMEKEGRKKQKSGLYRLLL